MTTHFRMLEDGAFVAGDPDTGLTAYAYPTSISATKARKTPVTVAKEMLSREVVTRTHDRTDYDLRNWQRLEGVQQPAAAGLSQGRNAPDG